METKSELFFFVNGEKHTPALVDPEMTLLTYLRDVGLTGTKLGCGEGGCGACTVSVSHRDAVSGKTVHRAVNACIAPVCSVEGMHVTTVEGIGSSKEMHPVQERLATCHGSQCGFCTPGIVMSMYSLLRQDKKDLAPVEIEDAFDGNLCRCTGYRPILDAFKTFSKGATVKPDCKPYNPEAEPPFPSDLASHVPASMSVKGSKGSWHQPTDLKSLLELRAALPDAKLVVGNSELEIERKFRGSTWTDIVSVAHVKELLEISATEEGLRVGASVTLSTLQAHLQHLVATLPTTQTRIFTSILQQLRWFAGAQIRNVASVGGNIVTASPISDLNPVFIASGSIFRLTAPNGSERDVPAREFFLSYRKTAMQPDEILHSILVPFTTEHQYVLSYKQSRRREDDIAIVTACINVTLSNVGDGIPTVQSAALGFGGMAPTSVSAPLAAAVLAGKEWTQASITVALVALAEDLPLPPGAPGGMIEYRRTLASSFLFKFFLAVAAEVCPTKPDVRELTGALPYHRPETSGHVSFTPSLTQGKAVGQDLPHRAAHLQVTGEAQYCDDIPPAAKQLYGALVLSAKPRAKLLSVDATAALAVPGVRHFVDRSDVAGDNHIGAILQDETVFAEGEVVHVGQVIGLICADSHAIAHKAAKLVKIEYEEQKPILSIDDAIAADSYISQPNILERGDVKTAMAEAEAAGRVVEGDLHVGGQEHFYLETQASAVMPEEDGDLTVWTSAQNTAKTQTVIAKVLGVPKNKVTVKVKRMGGGFGGKETRNAFIACTLAVAANKLHRPVRLMLDRDTDMCITGQRHAFLFKYKVAYDADGKLTAIDAKVYSNAGCTMDLSGPVLERAMFHIDNAYYCPNMRVEGRMCKTNLPSNTAFRGFGGPQGLICAETYIDHIARALGKTPEAIRELNFYEPHHTTHFGQSVAEAPVRDIWAQLKASSDFENRKAAVDAFNQGSRWRKRGISMTPVKFGMSFTATFMNAASALVHVYTDGSVLIAHGGTEMGQGLHTKMTQVVAECLGVPMNMVRVGDTATDTCANTHPTAASVSADLNGMALLDACCQIKQRMAPVAARHPDKDFAALALQCWLERIDLSAHGFYKTPDIGFDWTTKTGKPFHYFGCGAAVSEVEVDVLTGDHTVIRTDLLHDVGCSLNPALDLGQVEGAFVQGYGLFTMEELVWFPNGQLFTRGPSTYKIPSFNDIPLDFRTGLYHNKEANERTVYSSKGVGEPPLFLAGSVFFALKEALASARAEGGVSGPFHLDSPLTCERIRMACPDFMTKQFVPEAPEKYQAKGFW